MISVVADGEQVIDMRVPTRDAITALPPREIKPRKVNGEITGMGRGDERGSRIEVGEGAMYLAPGLTVEAALEMVKNRMHVIGIAPWDGDSFVIDRPLYRKNLEVG